MDTNPPALTGISPVGTPPRGCPVSDWDLYDEQALLDPYPNYAELRRQGGVVFLSRYGIYALPRYETTRSALADWRAFSSAHGVMLNDVMNDFARGSLLCSDPPEHDVKREVVMGPLTSPALKTIRDDIMTEAETLVEGVCARGSFNAAAELAEQLPLSIVATRVGLPSAEREKMLVWARAAFDCIGPIDKPRTQAAFPIVEEFGGFVRANAAREKIVPGSWLEGLYRAADAGAISPEDCGPMSNDYIGPSVDTTISALASAIWLFAEHPEQWDLVRANPSIVSNSVNEILRLETPIQGWTRYVTSDSEMEGVTIPAGSRVLVMFGSANRDERRWDDPDAFDVTREARDHLGFGFGEHICAGRNLARLEIIAVLRALAKRVARFELTGTPSRAITQVTRGWQEIPVKVHLHDH